MKPRFLLILLSLLIVLPACGGGTIKKRKAKPKPTLGPSVASGPVQERTFAPPKSNETQYLLYLRDSQDRPIHKALTAILVQQPEPLAMRQPRRKTIQQEQMSGLDGLVAFTVEADGKTKYLWVGGEGITPQVIDAGIAAGGQVIKKKMSMEVIPVAKMLINDVNGYAVPNAIVTFKPLSTGKEPAGENIGNRPGSNANYVATLRTSLSGKVNFTRKPGRYALIATKEKGSCRLYKIVDWDGDGSKLLTFQLPAKSMTAPPW